MKHRITKPLKAMRRLNATKKWKTVLKVFLWIYLATLILTLLHFGRRILVADSFRIPSASMSPTLLPGDRVTVNKLLFGPRIYTSFDFSPGNPLRCIRLPGIRAVQPGDIIVFNFPFGGADWSHIEFRINDVYCKRVLGCPGDTVGIADCHCWNSRVPGVIGIAKNQDRLRMMPDSILWQNWSMRTIPLSLPVWDVRNMGPLTVPAAGMRVRLTELTAELYRQVIEYETGSSLVAESGGRYKIGAVEITHYRFTQNWYFALGDNSTDSQDSRFWGFIPEDFIVGIVSSVRH